MRKQTIKFLLGFVLWTAFATANSAAAQTTIFNVPTTDVVSPKSAYLEADFLAHFDATSRGGFQSYGYRIVYGVRRNLEIGANFFVSRNGSKTAPKEFQPNLKWKVYANERLGVGVSGGAIFFVLLDKSAGTRTFAMVYGNASKTVKRLNGARLTGGFYTLIGSPRSAGTKSGAIAGVEQPVFRRLSFIADWSSGTNRFGYSFAGFGLGVTKRLYLNAGYNFGNTGRGNNYFAATYGVAF